MKIIFKLLWHSGPVWIAAALLALLTFPFLGIHSLWVMLLVLGGYFALCTHFVLAAHQESRQAHLLNLVRVSDADFSKGQSSRP